MQNIEKSFGAVKALEDVRFEAAEGEVHTLIGYIGSGLMAGVASIFWSASFATIAVATGNGMELDAIAAVYISERDDRCPGGLDLFENCPVKTTGKCPYRRPDRTPRNRYVEGWK